MKRTFEIDFGDKDTVGLAAHDLKAYLGSHAFPAHTWPVAVREIAPGPTPGQQAVLDAAVELYCSVGRGDPLADKYDAEDNLYVAVERMGTPLPPQI